MDQGRHAKFCIVTLAESEQAALPKAVQGVALRILRRADMLALATRIQNWSQIVPYRVCYAGQVDRRLQQDIWTRLERPHRLERLEAAFHPLDVTTVRAALFELLAAGRVVAPDLDSAPLGLSTLFRRRAA